MNIAPSAPSAGLTALGMSQNAAAGTPAPGGGSPASFGTLIVAAQNGPTMDIQTSQNSALPIIAADRRVAGEIATIPTLPEIMGQPPETDFLGNTASAPENEAAPTAGQADKAIVGGKPANATGPQLATPLVEGMAPEDGVMATIADPSEAQSATTAEEFQPAVPDVEIASEALGPDHPDEAVAGSPPIDLLLSSTPVAVNSPPLHQASPSSTPVPVAEFAEADISTPSAAVATQAIGGAEVSGRGTAVAENMAVPAAVEAASGANDLPEGLPASLMSQALPGASHRSAGVDQLYGGMPAAAQHLPVATARPGQIGREMGVEIARQITAGKEELCVRLDPAELGRIDVRMSFERDGGLRAVVTAESSIALDMLRRDAGDLTRALVDAGVRADAGSFRFDGRSGDGQRGQSQAEQGGGERGRGHASTPDEEIPQYRRLATSGRVDMMA